MNYPVLTISLISLVSLIAGAALFQLSSGPEVAPQAQSDAASAVDVGNKLRLESIPLFDLQGKQSLLGDWQQPVLVINFWAPWCGPCRSEVPALISIQQDYAGQVQILGLALDSAENVTDFSAEYGMNYPSFLAGNHIALYNAAFRNRSGSLPYTAIIDQDRQLGYLHSGEISADKLREELAKLL